GMVSDGVASTVGHVKVTAVAPDLVPSDGAAGSQLNLFLYRVSPNPGWRNEGLPARDTTGARISNPPLALALHYLLTAYGAKDPHADIPPGHGMQALPEVPIPPRALIRRVLGTPGLVTDPDNVIPPELEAVGASALGEQVEAIKISPDDFGVEELSRLWSAF